MHTTLWFGRRHTTASAGASLALQRIQTRQQRHRSVKDAPHLRNRIATNRDVVSPELAGISGKIRYRPSKRQFAFTLGKMVRRLDRWNLWKAFAVSQSQTRLRIASSSTSRVTSPTPPDQKSIDLRRSFVRLVRVSNWNAESLYHMTNIYRVQALHHAKNTKSLPRLVNLPKFLLNPRLHSFGWILYGKREREIPCPPLVQ